jgi:hypothetical protein
MNEKAILFVCKMLKNFPEQEPDEFNYDYFFLRSRGARKTLSWLRISQHKLFNVVFQNNFSFI